MVFPIAVGTGPRHSSSRPFPRAKENANSDFESQDNDVVMVTGTNDDETLTATVFISYQFLPPAKTAASDQVAGNELEVIESKADVDGGISATNNDINSKEFGGQTNDSMPADSPPKGPIEMECSDHEFNVIAELRVQIMPTTSPFVSNMDAMSSRETKSRVPLGIMRRRRSHLMRTNESFTAAYAPNASIEFSSNETHLACLIPLPMNYELIPPSDSCHDSFSSGGRSNTPSSTIVIFRVRAKAFTSKQYLQQRRKRNLPKLPEYIVEKVADEEITKEETDNVKVHMAEKNDHLGLNDTEEENAARSSAKTIHSTRTSVSYVAHEPKIVRVPGTMNYGRNGAVPNHSFLRKLSGGSSARGPPVQIPSLQCATCMCNVPFDHHRGKSNLAVSLLLVGTTDSKLLLVDYSTARVMSVALESIIIDNLLEKHGGDESNTPNEQNGHRNNSTQQNITDGHGQYCNPIIHISQCTPSQWKPLDVYGEEQGSESKGRIAAVFRDGSVNIFTTSFVPISTLPHDQVNNESDHSNTFDRGNVNRINGNRHIGLEMRINLLSTFCAAKSNSDAPSSHLRYIRAKWLNSLVLVLLTRSPYLDQHFLHGQNKAMGTAQSEFAVSQVWTVAEVIDEKQNTQRECVGQDIGWETPADVCANISLVSELKMPCGDGIEDLVYDTFSLSMKNVCASGSCVDAKRPHALIFSEYTRGMGIGYHRGTDILTVNSQVMTYSTDSTGVTSLKVRPFCLVWDWKRNVPGLTLASSTSYCEYIQRQDVPSLYSCLQLGEDDEYGLCAVHVYEKTCQRKRRRAVKFIFSLARLSPLNRFASEGSLSLNEPSAILLHHDSVTFPFLERPSNSIDVELKWEESRVPPSYIASNGPCQIAAVGNSGRSLAVAASRGLCILDLSRMGQYETGQPGSMLSSNPFLSQSPRWKLFSSINDEQRFRVLSMVWWECAYEDILIAAVKYSNIDTPHLVCWSRKSIGFGESQLLKESSAYLSRGGEGNVESSDYGIALPPQFCVHSMSIMKDPADSLQSGQSTLPNRALLLISYVSANSCVDYAAYQLQAIQSIGKYGLVLARTSSSGRIPLQLGVSPDLSASDSVTGIFLAGGSFLFDLEKEAEDSVSQDTVAVIGVVTLFQGLVAVCVSQTGPILYRPSLLESDSISNSHLGHKKGVIVAFWVSGTISNRYSCRVAWNIAKNDGKVYCWSVPCRNAKNRNQSSVELIGSKCSEMLPGLEKHSVLGEICHLGHSSLWMNGAATSEQEISIGPLFGCTLYAGQRSRRNIHSSNSGAVNSFHISKCIVAPPQLTPFLFISFLKLSSRDNDVEWQLVNSWGQDSSSSLGDEPYHEVVRDHIKSSLIQIKGLGSSSSALRIITLKVVELLNESKAIEKLGTGRQDDISDDNQLLIQQWAVGKKILSEIVTVVREMYDTLGFATFFLSIGRQLEPHQFNLIFPLPEISSETKSQPMCTAEELFSVSCKYGSLTTAVSALPLFSCHEESHQSVSKLIYHCLIKIEETFQSCFSCTTLTCGEDEQFLHQLFWFGVKLEDAIEIENSYRIEEDESYCTAESEEDENLFGSSQSSIASSSESYDESSFDEDTDEFVSVSASVESFTADYTLDTYSSEESRQLSFLSPCTPRTPRRKPKVGLVKKVVKKLFSSADPPANSIEEDAIHEAASSFIFSGFDESPIKSPCKPVQSVRQYENDIVESDLEPVGDESTHSQDNPSSDVPVPTSVAGAVCIFISQAIQFGASHDNSDVPDHGWKAVSIVAHLLQGDRETPAITTAGSSNAQRAALSLTRQDFRSLISAHDHLVADENESDKAITTFLVKLTSGCGEQNSQAVGTVFNLVLLLLLRYDSCPDVQLCIASLISVGIVSGHLSGRIAELIDLSGISCDVKDIYSLYVEQLDA